MPQRRFPLIEVSELPNTKTPSTHMECALPFTMSRNVCGAAVPLASS